jgi:Fungal protein kinase
MLLLLGSLILLSQLVRSLWNIGQTLRAKHCIRGRATHIFEIPAPHHPTLVVKESWPLRIRATEHEMFQQVSGRFGIPRIHNVVLALDRASLDRLSAFCLMQSSLLSTIFGSIISLLRGRDGHVSTLRDQIRLRQTKAVEILFPLIDDWFSFFQRARATVKDLEIHHAPHLSPIHQHNFRRAVEPLTILWGIYLNST